MVEREDGIRIFGNLYIGNKVGVVCPSESDGQEFIFTSRSL
jgi:hypothetical protein